MTKRVRRFFQQFNGLMTVPDFLGVIGFWLYRGTVRRTMSVGVALFALMLVGKKFDIWQALTGTWTIFLISCLGGITLMVLSGSVAKSQLTLGEAKGSNLLEDMKMDRADEHCLHLWKHVFHLEQDLHTSDEMHDELRLIEKNQPDLNRICLPVPTRMLAYERIYELEAVLAELGLTERGFRLVYQFASQVPMPRSLMQRRLRYDLSAIRDWYDGAPFHSTDTKLSEHFVASEYLQQIKADVQMTFRQFFPYKRKLITQAFWFKMISRAIQLRIASACKTLDKKYRHCHFSPDHFLWPTRSTHELVARQGGEEAVHDLFEYRRRIFDRVLCPDPQLAHMFIQRTIYPSFEAASLLRYLYDYEYATGKTSHSYSRDVREFYTAFKRHRSDKSKARDLPGISKRLRKKQIREYRKRKKTVIESRHKQRLLNEFLEQHDGLVKSSDVEAMRAARIAMHTNYRSLMDLIVGRAGVTDSAAPVRIIEDVVAEKRRFTQRLLAIRTHHELTRLELLGYEFYLDRILEGE